MKLLIDGIEAASGSEGNFWPFQTGAFPVYAPLFADSKLNDYLGDVTESIELEIDHVFWNGYENEKIEGKVTNLYLVNRDAVLRGHRFRWWMTDTRHYLSRLWTFEEFSQRQPLNEFNRVGVATQRFFNQTPKLGYITFTQRDAASSPEKPRFVRGNAGHGSGQPWTAYQGVFYYLTTYFDTQPDDIIPGHPRWRPQILNLANDNGYPLTDLKTNQPWPYTMTKLLRLARLTLCLNARGVYVVQNAAPADLSELGGYDGAERPTVEYKPGKKPRRTRVMFRKEMELRLNGRELPSGSESSTTTVEREERGAVIDPSLYLENVLILPQDVKEVATGKVYQRGVIVPIWKACELWNQDPENPPPLIRNGNGANTGGRIRFSIEWIRRNISSPSLATQMTFIPRVNGRDNVFAARASALYNSFRRVWRIPTLWKDFIDSVRLERTAIQDPVTGKRAPCVVAVDHFVEYNARYFHYKATTKDVKMGENAFAWKGALQNVTDFDRLPMSSAEFSPYQVSWVNQRQLVFKISELPDLYGNTERLILATYDKDKIPVCKAGGGGAQIWDWSQMNQQAQFRLSVIVSATLRTPNDSRKMFAMDFGPVSPDANGPVQEILFGGTHAGFEWLDEDDPNKAAGGGKKSRVQIKDGQVEVTGGRLTNRKIVEDAAQAIYDQVVLDNEDRELGTFPSPGWDEERIPVGHIGSATLVHRNGRVETVYQASSPPQPKTIWELLPDASRNWLFRLEGEPQK